MADLQIADQQPPASPPASAQANQDAIVVEGERRAPASDPLEKVNETSFAVTRSADHALVGPVALGYKHVIPKPIRDGLRNALANLHEQIDKSLHQLREEAPDPYAALRRLYLHERQAEIDSLRGQVTSAN